MKIDFDPEKNARNIRERGLSFEQAVVFDFENAVYEVDNRREYGEIRMRALGFLGNRLYVMIFVRLLYGIRVISFRKANKREERKYEKTTRS